MIMMMMRKQSYLNIIIIIGALRYANYYVWVQWLGMLAFRVRNKRQAYVRFSKHTHTHTDPFYCH